MSDDEIEPDYEYDYNDYDNNNHVDDDDPEPMLEDRFYEGTDFLKKGKNKEAIQTFKKLIQESKEHNSMTWILKCMNYILQLQCRQNLIQCKATLSNLIQQVDKFSKKESQDNLKLAIENIKELKNQHIYLDCKNILEQSIIKKTDTVVKIKTLTRLADLCLHDEEFDRFKKILEILKIQEQKGEYPADKRTQFRLELYCLEIQYIQKTGGSIQKIKQIAKAAQNLKSQVTDSRIMAIIKENIGKMLVYEGDYQKAAVQLMDAFKEYINIGHPNAKNMLKYAAFIGILSKLQINPFFNIQTKIYQEDVEIVAIENLRNSFEKRDIKSFYRQIESQHIKNDQFLAPLINQLKQIMNIEKLLIILKPYERIKFDYLSKILKTTVKHIQKYIFTLIVEGKIQGKINAIEGYFEKNKNYNKFLNEQEQIIEQFLKTLEVR